MGAKRLAREFQVSGPLLGFDRLGADRYATKQCIGSLAGVAASVVAGERSSLSHDCYG
jgi:hypothetical protein